MYKLSIDITATRIVVKIVTTNGEFSIEISASTFLKTCNKIVVIKLTNMGTVRHIEIPTSTGFKMADSNVAMKKTKKNQDR